MKQQTYTVLLVIQDDLPPPARAVETLLAQALDGAGFNVKVAAVNFDCLQASHNVPICGRLRTQVGIE